MPRPLPPELRSSELLKVRLTPSELAVIDAAAKAAKATRSDYVRLALQGWIMLHPPPAMKRARG